MSNVECRISNFEMLNGIFLTQRIPGTKQKEENWNSERFEDNSPLALQPFNQKNTESCRWGCRLGDAVVSPSNFAGPSVSLACAVALSALT